MFIKPAMLTAFLSILVCDISGSNGVLSSLLGMEGATVALANKRGCTATITNVGGSTISTVTTKCLPCFEGFHIYSGDCHGGSMNELTQLYGNWTEGDNGWTGTAVLTPGLPSSTCGTCVGFAVSCSDPSCAESCTTNVYCP